MSSGAIKEKIESYGYTTNTGTLVAGAQTGITTDYNTGRKVGRDAHNHIDFSTDNEIHFKTNNETPVIKMKSSGEVEATSLDISGDADIDGTLEADAITIGGTNVVSGSLITTLGTITAGTWNGTAIDTAYLDTTLTSQTSILNTSLVLGRDADNQIKFSTDNQIIFEVDGEDNVIFKASGEIEATSLDISGNADIDGTLEADAITVNGTALTSVCSPVAGHASIATVGTITSGTWNGTAVASAYLDSDTAHLSGAQTFTGAKTFSSTLQGYKTVIKTVSSNTQLADSDSGKTIYWTGGSLELPDTAQAGQQYVIINNTGSAATPTLGSSNSISSGWTANAAMSDETARTYISPATNEWIYIG